MHDGDVATDGTLLAAPLTDIAPTPPRRDRRPVAFTAAVFVSALLLFAVQPLVTRMVLPDFGGSAAVWTTSVLFFQTALLLGYLYTHVATNRLRPSIQIRLHLVLFAVPALVLPLSVTATPGEGGTVAAVLRLLAGLTVGVGGPFLLVSTSGPLLQRWFSWTDHRRADDPYFLYAASNVGSILGLVSYPVIVEPLLDLRAQAVVWTVGYVLLGALLVLCATRVVRADAGGWSAPTALAAQRPAPRQIAQWSVLAFLPSSLMLGTTSLVSTDIASVPLLWVAPLALYLGTFVVAFGGHAASAGRWAARLVAPTTVVTAIAAVLDWPLPILIVAALTTFTLFAMVLHARLAGSRPPAGQLTAFYVWMSVGGALGGLFNGVVAPLALPGPFEYPIVLFVAAFAVGGSLATLTGGSAARLALAGAVIIAGTLALGAAVAAAPTWPLAILAVGYACWLAIAPAGRSVLAVVAAVLLLGAPIVVPYVGVDRAARSFYGSYRVERADGETVLASGTTVHGAQSDDPARSGPLSYYHPSGPLGDWLPVADPDARIGVIGLGAGSIAAYGRPGQTVRFHEIDPLVEELARSDFDFLAEARGDVGVVIGDGRLTLHDVATDEYDVLVIDAFTSDAIPVHLLTTEAFELYERVLAPDGALLVHISNRYLDLRPVVAAGTDAIGLDVRVGRDEGGRDDGSSGSLWMAATREPSALHRLDDDLWRPAPPVRIAWTDSFSNLVQVLARP
jgi:hypothetical protein